MNYTVRIDNENNRFFIKTSDEVLSELYFTRVSPEIYELNFLNSNNESSSEALLYNALLFAQKEGIKIIPACDKVSNYLGRHKEFLCVTYNPLETALSIP